MSSLAVKPLSPETWPAYADLIERHGGVWGGCWCMGFHHGTRCEEGQTGGHRERKHRRVCEGTAHAAVVFDGEVAIGWCQYGPAEEIRPQNKFKRKYLPGLVEDPDWRISCFFVDRKRRGQGVASLALSGALEAIAREGGGLVEAYPENVIGRKVSGAFIYLGTLEMFEKHGFQKERQVAMHHWVMKKVVEPICL